MKDSTLSNFSSLLVSSSQSTPIIVKELDNLRLQCAATGVPKPMIVWSRADGGPFDWGKWKDNTRISQSINITSINRIHMGEYRCTADNGITPNDQYIFKVEVHCKMPRKSLRVSQVFICFQLNQS
jgi:Immunoglobulin domain